MVDEREDEIERLRHDGRVFRWSRRWSREGWPGHTTFVALKGGEVVVGDRYAGEGVERTYACDPASLLDGCFQELVAQQLGPRVLEELLAEVRRALGVAARPDERPKGAGAPTKNAREPAVATITTVAAEPSGAAPGASAPATKPSPTPVVSAHSSPRPAPVASERPSAAAPPVRTSTPVAVSLPAAGRVDLTLVACPSVSLPLAVALRGITRTSVHELLGRLRSLPCRVAAGVPREQAEGLAARLAELGAEVQLLPAAAS